MPQPRKPTALRLVSGAAQTNGSRIPKNEPDYVTPGLLPPPDDLDAVAAAKWEEVYPQLLQSGVLKATDLGSFRNYCVQWSLWTEALSLIRSQGVVIEDKYGNPKKNQACTVFNEASKEIRAIETLFGLNPSARGGISVGKKKKDQDFTGRRRR